MIALQCSQSSTPSGDYEGERRGFATYSVLWAWHSYALQNSMWDVHLCCFTVCPTSESVIMTAGLIINLVLQCWCTYLVGTNLIQNPWDVDTLDGLLSFRSRVGHSAAFADSVSFPSLISRVCDRWQFAFRHDTNNSRRGFEAVLGNRYHDPFHCWLSDLYGGTYSMDFHCSQITCRKSLLHVEHLAHSNAIVNTGRL